MDLETMKVATNQAKAAELEDRDRDDHIAEELTEMIWQSLGKSTGDFSPSVSFSRTGEETRLGWWIEDDEVESKDEIGLIERVQATSGQDRITLAESSEDELLYDHSNNVEFLETDSAVTAAGGNVSANVVEGKEKAQNTEEGASVEEKGLARGHDEPGLPRGAGSKCKAADSLVRNID
ncbi:hypothetical protein E8E12_007509 [Didymella heteroderae]|uniref:Uncharacterized protein n=1 Tax=Didymella heteroderae TaxID=1769908 RepID=A0A9P5BXY2_9PLEO|nr:hypothetical protein E8E12_007509 [Didymella heteroderae]